MFEDTRTARQVDEDLYYDLYKDVHGVRPRWIRFSDWSDEQLADNLNRLSAELQSRLDAERDHFQQLADSLGVSVATLHRWEDEAWEFELYGDHVGYVSKDQNRYDEYYG